jgi:hypothetical protein
MKMNLFANSAKKAFRQEPAFPNDTLWWLEIRNSRHVVKEHALPAKTDYLPQTLAEIIRARFHLKEKRNGFLPA